MKYGFLKSHVDIHTLGIYSIVGILEECGINTIVAPNDLCLLSDHIQYDIPYQILKRWLIKNDISVLSFSYRLGEKEAFIWFEKLFHKIKNDKDFGEYGINPIRRYTFAGLPFSCEMIKNRYGNLITTFEGDETPAQSLALYGIEPSRYPKWLTQNDIYDETRLSMAKELVASENYKKEKALSKSIGGSYDKTTKTFERVKLIKKNDENSFLVRAHLGPYSKDKKEAIYTYKKWLNQLTNTGHLDILSIGSSQLTQEAFNEDWSGKENGGGIPLQTPLDFIDIKENCGNLLVRAYSGTKSVRSYATMLDYTIDATWHALSLWWFNKSDGRGPLSVSDCLIQHLDTLKYLAEVGKPFEPNISHHFSFRGADDLTSIVAVYLAVNTAYRLGIRKVVLQCMLNTPKATSGTEDIVKFRTLLNLLNPLRQKGLKILFQPRAGLSYFSPDINKAKAQLAAVSYLMCDIKSNNHPISPDIVHVVSYSEAISLANPKILDESIQITRRACRDYIKNYGIKKIVSREILESIDNRVYLFNKECKTYIKFLENNIKDLYSAQGLYEAYKNGCFAVPQLWECQDEFKKGMNWRVRLIQGKMCIVDSMNTKMTIEKRIEKIKKMNSKISIKKKKRKINKTLV